jgi:2,4-dienoyl-CoA reductase (NADPH2)
VEQGKKVEIVAPGLFVGMELVSTMDLLPFYARVRTKGAIFSPNMALKEISGNEVVVIDIYANSVRRIAADTVVYATFNQADNQLYRSLKGKVKELHAAGDCVAPRKALDAISDGYGVGRIL